MPDRKAVSRLSVVLLLTSTAAGAQEPFALPRTPPDEPPAPGWLAPPPRPPAPEPIARVRWSRHDEAVAGASIFAGGYALGAAIFVLPAIASFDGKKKTDAIVDAEQRLALIPVAGPLLWWATAYARIHAVARYEKDHPCDGPDSGGGCWRTGGIDQFFHVAFALPYAIASSAAQGIGLVLATHAALRSDVVVTPTLGGLSVRGTW